MSKLTELLDELCPDGVEYRPLGELCSKTSRFKWENLLGNAQYVDLTSVDIPTRRISATTEVDESTAPSRAQQEIRFGDVLFGTTRPTQMRICIVPEAYDKQVASTGYCVLRAEQDVVLPSWLFYTLQTSRFAVFLENNQSTGSYPAISDKKLKQYQIPVPPLEVQQEIVRVLDAFTDLEQSLVSELELRKKQFDSVRRSVISDSQAAEKKVLRLREAESEGIVTLGRGKVISKKDIAANPGDYPVYSSSGAGNGEFGRYGNYMFDDERISWSVDGGGRLFYRPAHRYSVTNVSGWMTVNISDLQVKYLYYVLLSQWENESFDYTRKAHPSVIREVYAFSIPTIEIQDEVVSKLDSLESLIQSIEQEISLRRKQYEFYRDELLSFTRKEA